MPEFKKELCNRFSVESLGDVVVRNPILNESHFLSSFCRSIEGRNQVWGQTV